MNRDVLSNGNQASRNTKRVSATPVKGRSGFKRGRIRRSIIIDGTNISELSNEELKGLHTLVTGGNFNQLLRENARANKERGRSGVRRIASVVDPPMRINGNATQAVHEQRIEISQQVFQPVFMIQSPVTPKGFEGDLPINENRPIKENTCQCIEQPSHVLGHASVVQPTAAAAQGLEKWTAPILCGDKEVDLDQGEMEEKKELVEEQFVDRNEEPIVIRNLAYNYHFDHDYAVPADLRPVDMMFSKYEEAEPRSEPECVRCTYGGYLIDYLNAQSTPFVAGGRIFIDEDIQREDNRL